MQDRGGHGADGGVDLVAKRGDQRYYVQCKHWKTQQVGVNVVRELAGIVATNGAAGGYVVASGRYTREAQEFGLKAGLHLLDGPLLLEFLEEGRSRERNSRETGGEGFGNIINLNFKLLKLYNIYSTTLRSGISGLASADTLVQIQKETTLFAFGPRILPNSCSAP